MNQMSHGTLWVCKQVESACHFFGPNIDPKVIYSSDPRVYDTDKHALRKNCAWKEVQLNALLLYTSVECNLN